ncbi:MAG: uroporphyrinogen-III synthase [Desulfurococcaceae archaeon]
MQKGEVKCVLIAGTRETSSRYAKELRRSGINAHGYSVLEVKPTVNGDLLGVVEGVDFGVAVFTSRNAVRILLASASQALKLKISGCTIYAIGEGTRNELKLHGFNSVRVPARESSIGLLEVVRRDGVEGRAIAIFHSLKVNEELINGLRGLGASVRSFPLYDIAVNEGEARRMLEALRCEALASVMFLAKTAFQALINIDSRAAHMLKGRLVVALGEMVSRSLSLHGIPHRVLYKPNVGSAIALMRGLA